MGLFDIFKGISSVSDNDEYCLDLLRDEEEYGLVKSLVKKNILGFELRTFGLTIFEDGDYFQIFQHRQDSIDYEHLMAKVNDRLRSKAEEEHFQKFAKKSYGIIPNIIAANMTGMEDLKKAVALQLFAKEPLHLLVLADEKIKKSELLESA